MDDPAPAAPRRRLSAKPVKARYSGSDDEDELDVPDYDIQAESAQLARPSLGRTSARAIRPDSGEFPAACWLAQTHTPWKTLLHNSFIVTP